MEVDPGRWNEYNAVLAYLGGCGGPVRTPSVRFEPIEQGGQPSGSCALNSGVVLIPDTIREVTAAVCLFERMWWSCKDPLSVGRW